MCKINTGRQSYKHLALLFLQLYIPNPCELMQHCRLHVGYRCTFSRFGKSTWFHFLVLYLPFLCPKSVLLILYFHSHLSATKMHRDVVKVIQKITLILYILGVSILSFIKKAKGGKGESLMACLIFFLLFWVLKNIS